MSTVPPVATRHEGVQMFWSWSLLLPTIWVVLQEWMKSNAVFYSLLQKLGARL